MLKNIFIYLILSVTLVSGQVLKLNSSDEKALSALGVNILSCSNSLQAFVEDNGKKSTIHLSKIKLNKNYNNYKVYNPFYYEEKDKNYDGQERNAIIIITADKINVVIDQYSRYPASLGAVYPFKIELIDAKKLKVRLPKTVNVKQGIVIPTPAGIDMYLFWNGKKYELFTADEMP